MSLIPQEFIQQLLDRVDLVEVVGKSVQLKKAGTNYKGLCPFHEERTASFTVSPSKQFYHCFGCGAHGSAIGFVMARAGTSFPEAVRELARDAGLEVPEQAVDPATERRSAEQRDHRQRLREVLEQAARYYRDRLRGDQRAIAYLKGRGINGRAAKRFGLGYAPDDWQALAQAFPNYQADVLVESGLVVARDEHGENLEPARAGAARVSRRYDRLRDRITFPIRNVQGELIGFGGRVLDRGEPKYLNSPETPLFHKGEELYGLFEARQAVQRRGQALVVEGYLDVIVLAQHGIEHAVATLGTACTADQVRRLFRHGPQVVFAFDGDAAGRKAASRAMQAALPALDDTRSVKFLFLPPEHDPDSFVRAHGAEAFEREVARSRPLSVFLLDSVADGLALDTAEGRAQASVRARDLLRLLPASALKQQIVGELAQRLRAAPQSLLADSPAQRGRSMPDARARGAAPPSRHLQHPRGDHPATAVRILLAHPELWNEVSPAQRDLLAAAPGAAGELARWLESYGDEHPDANASHRWESLRASGLLEAAQTLRAAELVEQDAAQLQPDLRGALASIEMDWIKLRQQQLAELGLADQASRLEYQNLSLRLRELTLSLPRL